jgi:hypothetical protein
VLAIDFRDVVDAADVGMHELPRDADLGKESLAPHRVGCERCRQKLQRHRLAQLQIVGAVHLARPAGAEQADNSIAALEKGTGCETADRD